MSKLKIPLSPTEIDLITRDFGLDLDDLKTIISEEDIDPNLVTFELITRALVDDELKQAIRKMSNHEIQTMENCLRIIRQEFYLGSIVSNISNEIQYLLSNYSPTKLIQAITLETSQRFRVTLH